MRIGRPKLGETRGKSGPARLPKVMLKKLLAIAKDRKCAIGDVVASLGGDEIDRAYGELMGRRPPRKR